MLIRKLRIEKGWSQETLADISGLSVRTIQRIERGGNASLESLGALAAAFEVDIATLATEAGMYKQKDLPEDERETIEYVRDIKGFYSHVAIYVVATAAMAATNLYMGLNYIWFIWPMLGWGMGVISHGLVVFEVISPFGIEWERRQIKKRMDMFRT